MRQISQILGFLGTMTVAIGYLPQIRHLARERCSAGVSIIAWQVWLLSSFLIFSHAFEMLDPVFIALQTVHIVAIILIISLARRYKGMTCAFHRLLASQPVGSATGG
jgi:lipid-A-disaccharide synthase-like uncharacterized protein